jgi:peptidoglycan L-alanyl-D-glutamate endopeptidase CwlK
MASLTAASLKRLEGVHPDLVKVVKRAAEITTQPFQVTEGLRSLNRQRELVRKGASRTMRSRHLAAPNGLGHAIDLVAMIGGRVSWEIPLYHRLADAMKKAARELGVPIEWGGDWKGFFDGPHIQLPWDRYPGTKSVSQPAPPAPTERELGTLVPGSHGEAVSKLQLDLFSLGQAIKVDGQYGPATRRALAAVLKAKGEKVTDIVTAPLAERITRWAKAASRPLKATP